MSNPLDPNAILGLLQKVFPTSDSTTAVFRAPHELLAALYHAVMVAVGFRFAGLGETGPPADSQKEAIILAPLPNDWNASDSFAFRYTHPQSQMTFVVKTVKLSNKLLIHGMGVEHNRVATLELNMDEFVSSSATFPFPKPPDTKLESTALRNLFQSEAKLSDLISRYKVNIVQKLIPGLTKPGYVEEGSQGTSAGSARTGEGNRSSSGRDVRGNDYEETGHDPLRIPGSGGRGREPRFGGMNATPIGGGGPFSIGDRDLDPMASMGGYANPLRGDPFGVNREGGGMIVGPGHPMFGPGGISGEYGPRSGGGVYGGPQPLPPQAVPPGARFDPIGPFGAPPYGGPGRMPGIPGNVPGGRGRGTGGPGSGYGRFSGEPDNDELPPVGANVLKGKMNWPCIRL